MTQPSTWQDRFRTVMARQDSAHRDYPNGTWRQRWLPGVCTHEHTRCTHGDEIIARGFRRVVCLTCGRALDRDLPQVCWFTGKPHFSAEPDLPFIAGVAE